MPQTATARLMHRDGDDWLTVAQAVDESGFSESTLRRHIVKGSLLVKRFGPTKRVRIRRRDFDRYLDN